MARRKKFIKIDVDALENTIIYIDSDGKNVTVKEDLQQFNAREYYMKRKPNDKLGECIDPKLTLFDIWDGMLRGKDFYYLIGVCDSFVRENMFNMLAQRIGVCYHVIYSLWLNDWNKVNVK